MSTGDRRYVVVDLDGTLTIDETHLPYPERRLNVEVAAGIGAAAGEGLGVMVLTARGMRTWKNDRASVEAHVRPGVVAWLDRHEVARDQVHVAKPWCGPRGYYVDDRNLHLEEFVWRFTGPYAGAPVRVVALGEPRGDAAVSHRALTRVERWFDVCCYDYADGTPGGVADRLLAPGDGRTAAWDLIVSLDGARLAPHAWLALHHPSLDGGPFASPSVAGNPPFALVRPARTAELGAPAALARALESP